jgi:predicted nucleic acid-binding protein
VIAIDTSSLAAYLSGAGGNDVEATELALQYRQAVLPPVALSELLSDPALPREPRALLLALPLLELTEGYWERAGFLRARTIAGGHKAKLADTLIAQACIDHGVPLVTRDRDFRHFVRTGGLQLLSSRART